MEANQLNGSVDILAQALRNVISEAVTQSVQSVHAEIKEDMAAMEKRLLDKMAANQVDHEAWIRNLDEKVTRLDDRMGRLEKRMDNFETRLPAGEQ